MFSSVSIWHCELRINFVLPLALWAFRPSNYSICFPGFLAYKQQTMGFLNANTFMIPNLKFVHLYQYPSISFNIPKPYWLFFLTYFWIKPFSIISVLFIFTLSCLGHKPLEASLLFSCMSRSVSRSSLKFIPDLRMLCHPSHCQYLELRQYSFLAWIFILGNVPASSFSFHNITPCSN